MTSSRELAISRSSIGIGALILLVVGGWLTLSSSGSDAAWPEACLKTGIVLAVLWLAYPQMARIPGWALVVGVAAMGLILVATRKPSILVLAVAVIFVVSRFLPPRSRDSHDKR